MACAAIGPGTALAAKDPALVLHGQHQALIAQLRQNQFMRPLVLDSSETSERATGNIYAILEHPFSAVRAELDSPDHWCDILILHINTKYCKATGDKAATQLRVHIGKKTPEDLTNVPRFDLRYQSVSNTPLYLDIQLKAPDGPLGTSDYLIKLEAVPLPGETTFLHLTYSYSVGLLGRLALQTYLATAGRSKVGFTQISGKSSTTPTYVGGIRGVLERNTMRYYLGVDTFLATTRVATASQSEARLQNWFTAVQKYPRQLHEMDRNTYITMKRAEYSRQQMMQ